MRDLYRRKDLGVFQGSFTGAVLVHGVLALKVTPLRCACTASPMPPLRPSRALHVSSWVLSCAVKCCLTLTMTPAYLLVGCKIILVGRPGCSVSIQG